MAWQVNAKLWPLYFSSICIRFARSRVLSATAFREGITVCAPTDGFQPDGSVSRSYSSDTRVLGNISPHLSQKKEQFPQIPTTKAIPAQVGRQHQELRKRIANADSNAGAAGSAPKRRRLIGEARIEGANQQAELIQRGNHSNFIKMHYLNHFVQQVRNFGSVPMYSTDIGKLVHKEQIKIGYRRSNKNHAARPILAQYSKQHTIGMRLLTMEALRKADDKFETGKLGVSNQASRPTARPPQRALKGRTQNVTTGFVLSLILEIYYDDSLWS